MAILQREAQNGWEKFSSNFKSFNKCMSVIECKIPFIVLVVFGSLIVISVLYCVLRCCCCGYRVCRCCCGGCGGRREKKEKNLNFEISGPSPLPRFHDDDVPKFAYIEGGKSEDSLPIMPSLERTEYVHVTESHEMSPVSPLDYGRQSPMQQVNGPMRNGSPVLPLLHGGQSRTGTPLGNAMKDVERGNTYGEHLASERSPSRASSFYSTLMPASRLGHRTPSPAMNAGPRPQPTPGSRTKPPPVNRQNGPYLQTRPPRAPFVEGHRNTQQMAYNDVGVNPYQYNGPLRPGRMEQGAPELNSQSRPEEWTVI